MNLNEPAGNINEILHTRLCSTLNENLTLLNKSKTELPLDTYKLKKCEIFEKLHQELCHRVSYLAFCDIDSCSWEQKKLINRLVKYKNNEKQAKGYVWKVFNKETKVTHYVIGTIHTAMSKKMMEGNDFQKAMLNTEQLITEAGLFIINCRRCLQDEYPESKDFFEFIFKMEDEAAEQGPAGYVLDAELTKQAVNAGKSVQGLDTEECNKSGWAPQKEAFLNLVSTFKPVCTPSLISSEAFQNEIRKTSIIHSASKNLRSLSNVVMFRDGILEPMPKGSIFCDPELDAAQIPRNCHWLKKAPLHDTHGGTFKGLLSLIQQTKTPTCIAVGSSHCEDGDEPTALVPALKAAGFEVERL